MKHITRIAPAPTGMMHLGTARTALFNWLVARSTEGKMILRIDDTDINRNSVEAVKIIYDAMDWLGLDYDITFKQSDRLEVYTELANTLVKNDLAFYDDKAIRLRMHDILNWTDTITGKYMVSDQEKSNMNDLCIMKSDGYPTYHFASIVDDIDYNVSWIIRGVDHISNTPKQLAIAYALEQIGMKQFNPLWSHIGLITQNKKKLSKRDGAASVLTYRDQGIDSDALCNWMLRLGWGPTIDDKTTSMIDKNRALSLFLNGGKMRASPSNLDQMMLQSLDRKYKGMKKKNI